MVERLIGGSMAEHNQNTQADKPINIDFDSLDLDLDAMDSESAYTLEQIDSESGSKGIVDLDATQIQDVNDPCSGKTGIALNACKLGQLGKEWERKNGVFFNEGRADRAGGGLIIKGSGVKYKWGF